MYVTFTHIHIHVCYIYSYFYTWYVIVVGEPPLLLAESALVALQNCISSFRKQQHKQKLYVTGGKIHCVLYPQSTRPTTQFIPAGTLDRSAVLLPSLLEKIRVMTTSE